MRCTDDDDGDDDEQQHHRDELDDVNGNLLRFHQR
jgi:hypothetical protein